MYEGDYIAGREHGQGKILTGERDVIYEGEFFEGNFAGYGRLHFRNGKFKYRFKYRFTVVVGIISSIYFVIRIVWQE